MSITSLQVLEGDFEDTSLANIVQDFIQWEVLVFMKLI